MKYGRPQLTTSTIISETPLYAVRPFQRVVTNAPKHQATMVRSYHRGRNASKRDWSNSRAPISTLMTVAVILV